MFDVIPTALKNDRRYESLLGALPPANPARDTNRRKRWKSQRFRRLVSVAGSCMAHIRAPYCLGCQEQPCIGSVSLCRTIFSY